MNKLTDDQVQKLPKWAQEAFRSLQRERDAAVRELKEWLDEQSPSPISVSEHICDGDSKGPSFYTRYIQATDIEFKWMGVSLTVALRKDGPSHENSIQLQWSGERKFGGSYVAFVPTSFQSASLISKENMR